MCNYQLTIETLIGQSSESLFFLVRLVRVAHPELHGFRAEKLASMIFGIAHFELSLASTSTGF
jgi:hypothetical protein